MNTKSRYLALLTAVLFGTSTGRCGAQQQSKFQFEKFPVPLYSGPLKLPTEFHKTADGNWLDESGKAAEEPGINFAGEYFLAGHSCGTCCRYYTLDNLRTGAAVAGINIFSAGDPSPRTHDGKTYVPILFYKPGSRLLIVQYALNLCTQSKKEECRQRVFLFENGRFQPVSQTFRTCDKSLTE